MNKAKPIRIFIGFAIDNWTTDSYFHATLETPSAPYPLSFGKISDAECEEEGAEFSKTALAFVEVRRLIAADLGARFEIGQTTAHQLACLKKTAKLCDAEDCDQCC